MISAVLLLLLSAGRAFGADVYPAANAGYVRDAMFARTRCKLSNQAPDGAAINMEYLMRVVDLCNHNMTQYGSSVYATRHMANTRAVQWATDMTYVTDGLILILDATHMDDWVTHGPVTILPDGVKIDGAFVRTRDMINLAAYQNVTVEVRFKLWYDEQMLFYEHSSDWNKEICGFGTVFNVGTTTYIANSMHTNVSTGYVNYDVPLLDFISHTASKIYTTIDSAHHFSFYDGKLLTNPTLLVRQLYCDTFRNDYFYVGYRGQSPGSDYQQYGGIVHSLRIYNRALTADEICHNTWVDYRRFGGMVPTCTDK